MGIDYDDAGKFKIAESGFPGTNDALVIDVNRKVGIGTSNPNAKLTVAGNISGSGKIEINDGTRGARLGTDSSGTGNRSFLVLDPDSADGIGIGSDYLFLAQDGQSSTILQMPANSNFKLNATTTNRLTILGSNGNVGIGTDSPSASLHISHDSGDTVLLTKSTTEPSLRFEGDTDKDFVLTVSGETFTITQNDGVSDVLALDHDTKNAIFTGNVGIGDTTPDDASLSIISSDANVIDLSRQSVGTYRLAISSTDKFSIFDVGANSDRLVVDSSGNVGIGTTTTDSLLHLSGSSNNAIVTLENNGNGNVSGIDFVRERSTGPGVNGGSLFLESGTANNNSTIYLQAQTAGAGAGTTSALSADNGVRLVLKGGQGIFSVETGTSEAFKVDNGETVITGDLTVSGTLTATSIIETSTRELKDNIITLDSQDEIVDKLQPVSYTWKQDGVEDFGLIAEDVEEIAPYLVSRDDNGNPTGIKYSKLSVLLLDVVKKQSTLIEDLNKRITKLEDKT